MIDNPHLSIIIASFNSRSTIEMCLESLENQKTEKNFEIIVIDSSTDGTGKIVEENFPRVRLYRFPEKKFPGDARNIGISKAGGDIIAFIDADCVAEAGWVEEIIRAHESSDLAIGGAIANGSIESSTSWAAYFCEISKWMPGTSPGRMSDIAGANMSYKKEVFDRYGGFIEGTYCSDTDFHWRLGNDSHSLLFRPSILVYHNCIESFPKYIRHEYGHGQSFARVRVKSKGFSKLMRLLYVFFFFLIPVKLFLKVVLHNLRNRVYLSKFIKSSPLLMLGILSWSFGECVGYIKGWKDEKKSFAESY
jgi:glycosyltransferase involved in cell wall biosynthesis